MLIAIAVATLGGLIIGSFLNVVIARVPAGESVVRPASRCPACREPIAPRDNLPVVGWLLLRGRARCCGARIGVRYPLVEAGTAAAFGLVTSWAGGLAADPAGPLGGRGLGSVPGVLALVVLLYLAAISIALALIDIDVKRLPYMIVLQGWAVVGLGLAAASLLAGQRGAVVRLLVGAVVLWTFYRLSHAIYPAGMAYGDVRLSALVGGTLAWVGWGALAVGAFAGFLLGGVGGAALMVAGRAGRKSEIPYGPYMLLGMWTGLVGGSALFAGYLRLFGF